MDQADALPHVDCFINLIASAHRVPRFLIRREGDRHRVGASPVSPASERILAKWLRHAEQLQERGQFVKLSHLTTALSRADCFLFTLSNALDDVLCQKYADRRVVLGVHQAIMCSWLELTSIGNIAVISERWHQAVGNTQGQLADSSDGDELAWQLMQTHSLGSSFRRTLLHHVGTAM